MIQAMFNYLTTEPLSTSITDQTGNVIATWVSTNLRWPDETVEVEEAVRWASGPDKYLLIRKGDDNEC